MKKGFTLVELAIVLIVIGLLLGMAFKGKALVDAARIKAEVNKVEKLGTAINVYYSKYDTLPGVRGGTIALPGGGTATDNSSAAVYQTLVNEGMLKDTDFKSTNSASYWIFVGCNDDNGSWAPATISENVNLCVYRSSSAPSTYTTAVNATSDATTSGVSVCQLETILDDKNLQGGDGRIKKGGIPSGVDNSSWNCSDTTKYSNSPSGIEYLYRIF